MALSLPVADPTIQPQVRPPLSSDDILGEIDRAHQSLSPPAQDAISQAHGLMGLQAPGTPPAAPAPEPFQGIKPPVMSSLQEPPSPSGVPRGTDMGLPSIKTPTRIAAVPPPPTAHEANYARLTAPPRTSTDPLAHTKADTGLPGTGQIHNPWARIPVQILDAIGRGVLPGIEMGLPGTSGHHDVLVHQAGEAVKGDEAAQAARDKSALEQAQTGEAEARGESLLHPPGKVKDEELLYDKNGAPIGYRDTQGKYYGPDDENLPPGVKSVLAAAQPKFTPENVHVLPDGTVVAIHPDAKTGQPTSSVVYKGNPKVETEVTKLKVDGKDHTVLVNKKDGSTIKDLGESGEAEKTISPEQQFIDEYRNDPKNAKGGAKPSIADAEKAFKAIQPPDRADHGQNVFDKSGKLIRLEPGQTAPEGAVTAAGMNTANTPTTQMRNVGAQATLVHEQTPHMLSEIDRLKDQLGPISGKWHEFMQGKIGMNNPDMAGLRADLLMYSSAVALMHARGRLPENLREEFDNAINAPKQDPENLKAVINRIDGWTAQNMKAMQNTGAGASTNELPNGVTLEQIDAEIAKRKKK